MQTVTDNIYVLVLIAMLGGALLVVSLIMLQIRNQNKLLREKKRLYDAEVGYQKELLHAVITSQELERKRIGMDLHDEVGTVLSLLRLMIEEYNSGAGDVEPARHFAQQSKLMIDSIINKVRGITHNLSPRVNDSMSLYDALHDLTDHINLLGKCCMDFSADERNMHIQISGSTALALYRVVNELVNNTLKHAQAQHIHVSMFAAGDMLQVHYRDDGTGLPAVNVLSSRGTGMYNIESRLAVTGARYQVFTDTNGFSMQISLPLK